MRKALFLSFFALSAVSAVAHTGVQNPAVLARMDGMKSIGDAMKVLGLMAKGSTDFDATAAQEAAAAIARHAAKTPALFETREQDPKSEALDSIWQNFADFTDKSGALETAAKAARKDLTSAEALIPAVTRIGATCKSCHELYRK